MPMPRTLDVTPRDRVYVLDDDASLLGSLGSLFRSVGYEAVLFEAPEAFLATPAPDAPSCLVLDIRLGRESGLDFQRRLNEAGRAIPVILMTAHGDIPMTVRGMKAGAVDFLTKPFREEDMLAAVATAIRLDQDRRAAGDEVDLLQARHDSLSAREKEVMALVAAGLMNKQVAGRLGISEVTVKIHRGQAMRKMQAASLADLVRMADALGVRAAGLGRFSS